MAEILVSDPKRPDPTVAHRAATLLREGGVVALPTETVYGLAADALNPVACETIFRVKERPFSDPLIVHIPDRSWLERLALADPMAIALADAFWPGPLTLVLRKSGIVSGLISADQDTVAIRHSAHPVFQSVVSAFGGPLAAPSANRFGRISPTAASHVAEELGDRIPLIVDGGACAHGLESTIVHVHDGVLHVLRHGPITPSMLSAFGPVIAPELDAPTSPGSMKSHYAPRTPMEITSVDTLNAMPPDVRSKFGLILPGALECDINSLTDGFFRSELLSATGAMDGIAANLYAAMRRMDTCGCERIFVLPVESTGLGLAIMERLMKACARE